jgi:hypothetical protein
MSALGDLQETIDSAQKAWESSKLTLEEKISLLKKHGLDEEFEFLINPEDFSDPSWDSYGYCEDFERAMSITKACTKLETILKE